MSGLIQRLLDRGAATKSVPGAAPAVVSGSPMAQFDQRLQDSLFDAAPPPPPADMAFEGGADGEIAPVPGPSPFFAQPDPPVPSTPQAQAEGTRTFLNVPHLNAKEGPPSEVAPQAAAPVPADKLPLGPPATVAHMEKQGAGPITQPAPLPVAEPARPEHPQTKSAQAVQDTSESPSQDARPATVMQSTKQLSTRDIATPTVVAPKFVAEPHAFQSDDQMRPVIDRVAEPVSVRATQAAKIASADSPAVRPQTALPTAAPVPASAPLPAPAQPGVQTEKVIERIVREVPVEAKASPAPSAPMTAESVSKIGKLSERRRTRTLFGQRRR